MRVESKDFRVLPGLAEVTNEERMMEPDSQPMRVWSADVTDPLTKPVIAIVMGVSGRRGNRRLAREGRVRCAYLFRADADLPKYHHWRSV